MGDALFLTICLLGIFSPAIFYIIHVIRRDAAIERLSRSIGYDKQTIKDIFYLSRISKY